jgi:hypothetical protein
MRRNLGVLTEALGCCTLEQVINGSTHHCALAAGVNGEATNLDTVAASDVLNDRRLTDDLDKLFTGVAVLVDVANIARGHFRLEGDADCLLVGVSYTII